MRSRHVATGAAALLHAAYAIAGRAQDPSSAHLMHDAARYDAWARAIVAGHPFEAGAFSQAPAYPYAVAAVYALFGPRPGIVIALQVLLGVATVALVGRAAARAFGESAAAWAAWLCALYGVLAFYETKLLPAALGVALVALLIERLQVAELSESATRCLAAGAVAGALALTNAASLALVPLAAAWIAAGRARPIASRLRRALLFAAAASVVVAPVTLRNAAAGGGFVPVADNAGITFWQANNPGAVGVFSTPEGFTGAIATQRDESRRLAEADSGRPLRDAGVSTYWLGRGWAFLRSDPRHAAWLMGRKVLLTAASTEQPLEYSPRLDGPLRWLMPVPFAALAGLALVGAGASYRQRLAHPALLSIASTIVALLVFYVASRYRLPMIPGLAIVAGAGAAGVALSGWTARLAALAVVTFSLLWFPLTQQELARAQDAMSIRDRATALRETGRLDAAIAAYQRSLALAPADPYTHLDLGKALSRAGRGADAEAQIHEALAGAPELAEAHFDLGVLAFEGGRLDEAATAFAEAFRLAPADAAAGNNLIGTYLKAGRVADARATLGTMRARGLPVDPPLERALGGER